MRDGSDGAWISRRARHTAGDGVDRPCGRAGDRASEARFGAREPNPRRRPQPSPGVLARNELRRRPIPAGEILATGEFERWFTALDAERRAKVAGALERIAIGGPTIGRPHVDVIHGSRVRKLKEGRIDRGTRVLFAFDSNRRAIMLVGGDKTGRWNRWYPQKIQLAERLYLEHERRIGKEPLCLSQRDAGRTSGQRSR